MPKRILKTVGFLIVACVAGCAAVTPTFHEPFTAAYWQMIGGMSALLVLVFAVPVWNLFDENADV